MIECNEEDHKQLVFTMIPLLEALGSENTHIVCEKCEKDMWYLQCIYYEKELTEE